MNAPLDALEQHAPAFEAWRAALAPAPQPRGPTMHREPLKDPRRAGKHVSYAIDYLAGLGITGIEVVKTKHLRLSWPWGDGRLSIPLSCTPQCEKHACERARRLILRAIQEAAGRP